MNIIAWIIIGFLSGSIASLLVGDHGKGCCATMVVGMIGSLLGGAIILLWQKEPIDLTLEFTHLNITSLVVSTLGAVVFLAILKLIKR